MKRVVVFLWLLLPCCLFSCRELSEDVVVEFAPPAAFEAQLSIHLASTDTIFKNFNSLEVNLVEDEQKAVFDGFGRAGFKVWKGNLEIGIRKGVNISPINPYSFSLELKLPNHLSRIVRFNLTQQGTSFDTIRLVSLNKNMPGLAKGSFSLAMNAQGTVGVIANELNATRTDMAPPKVTILPGTHFVTENGQLPTSGVSNEMVYIDGSQQPDLLNSAFQAGIGVPVQLGRIAGSRRMMNNPERAFEIPLSFMSSIIRTTTNGWPDTAVIFSQPVKVEIPIVPDLLNPNTNAIIAPGDEINVSTYRPGILKKPISRTVYKVLEGQFDTIRSVLDSMAYEVKLDTIFRDIFNINAGAWCKMMIVNSEKIKKPIYKDTLIVKPVVVGVDVTDTFITTTSTLEGQKLAKIELNASGKPVAVIYDIRPGEYRTSWLVKYTKKQVRFKFSGYFDANSLMNEEEKASGPIPPERISIKILPDKIAQYTFGMNPPFVNQYMIRYIKDHPVFPIASFYIYHNSPSEVSTDLVEVPDLPNLYPHNSYRIPGANIVKSSLPGDPMEMEYDLTNVILTRVGCKIQCSNGLEVKSDGMGYVFEVQNSAPQPGPLLVRNGYCAGVIKLEKGVACTFALRPNSYYENWSNYNGVDLYYHYQITPPNGVSPIQTNANNNVGGVASIKLRAVTPRFYSMQYTINGVNNDLCK